MLKRITVYEWPDPKYERWVNIYWLCVSFEKHCLWFVHSWYSNHLVWLLDECIVLIMASVLTCAGVCLPIARKHLVVVTLFCKLDKSLCGVRCAWTIMLVWTMKKYFIGWSKNVYMVSGFILFGDVLARQCIGEDECKMNCAPLCIQILKIRKTGDNAKYDTVLLYVLWAEKVSWLLLIIVGVLYLLLGEEDCRGRRSHLTSLTSIRNKYGI